MSQNPDTTPTDPTTPPTTAEEADFALLVSIAANNADDKEAQRKPQQKTRVQFSQLAARGGLIRFLLAYAAGERPTKAMSRAGIVWGDIQIARICSSEYAAAYDWCVKSHDQMIALKAQSKVEGVLDGEDVGKGANLLRFLLERLRAADYGDPRYLHGATTGDGRNGGAAIQINLIQAAAPAQISDTSTPALCGECVAAPAIEVKTV